MGINKPNRRPAHAGLETNKYTSWKKSQDIKKKEFETKRYKKAATLRKYAKLCAREGIVSDRVNMSAKKTVGSSSDISEEPRHDNKKPKKNPFADAMRIAEERKLAKEQQLLEKKQREAEIEDAAKKREEKRKMHMKRTKKGQPLLGNQIQNMLTKLQGQKNA